MRIALVATGGFDRSGRERVIPSLVWFVERLARTHDVVVYVLRYHNTPHRYELRGATIVDLGRPEGYTAQRSALLNAIREDGPFDVVHAYWAQPSGRIVASVARSLGLPSVVTLDSGEFASIPSASYGLQSSIRGRLAVRLAGRLATRTTVCSEFQASLARTRGLHEIGCGSVSDHYGGRLAAGWQGVRRDAPVTETIDAPIAVLGAAAPAATGAGSITGAEPLAWACQSHLLEPS